MLCHLSISNYAIADQIDLEFDSGMSVLTGETGAGKSITLDALGLALGERADSKTVRAGAESAEIHAGFDIGTIPAAARWLTERDLHQGDELLLRRVIRADGKSRAYINGKPATGQDLKNLGTLLIDIHGQHEHQSLLKRETQRSLLDDYAGASALSQQIEQLARQRSQLQDHIDALRNQGEEQTARVQLLRYQVDELEQLALAEGEIEQLEKEQKTLAGAEDVLVASHQALQLCGSEDGASASVSQACRLLEQMPHPGEVLQDALLLLQAAHIQLEEGEQSLRLYIDSSEVNPLRLQEVEQRLSTAYQIARKHRVNASDLEELGSQLRSELNTLDGSDEKLLELEQERTVLDDKLLAKCKQLTAKRHKAAGKLAKAVNKLLKDLCMAHCQFEVVLEALAVPSIHGLENPELLVSTNPGHPAQPISKIASGGELSRLGLAIQVAASHSSHRPTLVFDEVDAGIGGGVAEVVGNLLRQLGQHCQVLCVTHLPQVACQGHHHFVVAKQVQRKRTHTEVLRLQDDAKVAEIARMLGGIAITDQTRAHAREMLATRH